MKKISIGIAMLLIVIVYQLLLNVFFIDFIDGNRLITSYKPL